MVLTSVRSSLVPSAPRKRTWKVLEFTLGNTSRPMILNSKNARPNAAIMYKETISLRLGSILSISFKNRALNLSKPDIFFSSLSSVAFSTASSFCSQASRSSSSAKPSSWLLSSWVFFIIQLAIIGTKVCARK